MRESAALNEAVRYFTCTSGIMDGLCVLAGRGEDLLLARSGRDAGPRAVYDLASVTKLFTGLCLLRLRELGRLDFSARITFYDPRFVHLSAVTVEQLAAFQKRIVTPERLDAQPTRERALACLLEAREEPWPSSGTRFTSPSAHPRFYSDIPAMILKYVLEAASGEPFYALLRRLVLSPAGMEETWARVPASRLGDCLLYGPEYRLEKGRPVCRRSPARGVPHDPKAALLQGRGGDLCGHAGLFSTAGDLARFCRALLAEKIVTGESLAAMAVNRTGRQYPDGTWSQHLGYLCHVRHPSQYFSEIPSSMTSSAFGIGGFTGTHLSVDPGSGLFTVFLGNRVRDRLTVLVPEPGKTFGSYGLSPDGSGLFRCPEDGSLHYSSVNYVHQKDARLHSVIARELGLA